MIMAINTDELIREAVIIMAAEDLEREEKSEWDGGINFFTSRRNSNEKVLLCVISDPRSKSGMVSADSVTQAIEVFEKREFDKGIFIGNRFTKAAKDQIQEKGIRIVSQDIKPIFDPGALYLAMQEHIDRMCIKKCGAVPRKESDCKGFSNGEYSCKVRLISDNAAFHFERGWTSLLERDFEQIIKMHSFKEDSKDELQ